MATELYNELMDLAETDPMKATDESAKHIKGVEHPEAEFGGEAAMRNLANNIAQFRTEFKIKQSLAKSIGCVLCRRSQNLAVMRFF